FRRVLFRSIAVPSRFSWTNLAESFTVWWMSAKANRRARQPGAAANGHRRSPSRRAEAARPKAQKQTETGRPTRTPGTSSTLGSLGGSERHGGAVAEAMPALRREPAAKARPGAYGRGAAAASGDRRASGEGAPPRVSVSQRGLWALRKGDAGAAARGDQRGLWTAGDGADRLLDGSLPVAAAAGGSHAGRCAGHRDQFGEYPESLGRSQPGGRTARSAVAGAVAARSGSPLTGGNSWKNRSRCRRSCSPWRRHTWTTRTARCATWLRRCSFTSNGCSRFWNVREWSRPTM